MARMFSPSRPAPPKESLFSRLLRRILCELSLPWVRIAELGHRFGRVLLQTEYRVTGQCKKRGRCCEHILVPVSDGWGLSRLASRVAMWRLTRMHRFFDRGLVWEVRPGILMRVMGCHAVLPDGRCGEYRLRPLFCRTYPELPLIGRPKLERGCGYRFEPRHGLRVLSDDEPQDPSLRA